LLQASGKEGTQKEIVEAFGMTQQWVSKYDEEPIQPHKEREIQHCCKSPSSNVWGLEDGKIAKIYPLQPGSALLQTPFPRRRGSGCHNDKPNTPIDTSGLATSGKLPEVIQANNPLRGN